MDIGLYVTTLRPRGASQTRLQDAIFSGLAEVAGAKYAFHVFSHDANPPRYNPPFRYHALRQSSPPSAPVRAARRMVTAPLASALWRTGNKTAARKLTRWSGVPEPAHFDQLRDLNIRLLWNVNHHELPCPVPYVRTIWDINHRIIPFFPEYSHARFTFSGLDRNLQASLARASYVVTGTSVGAQQLASIYGVAEAKMRVIPFPTPLLSTLSSDDERPRREDFIFYPARLWPHKNHTVILEALSLLRRQYGWSLKCVLTGAEEGNLSYLLRYAERLGVGDLIEFMGNVSEEELARLYASAFALVFASMAGPDNLPPLEAMSLHCPVITSDIPGAREQFGDAALYFPPTDETALAQRLIDLRGDERLREQLVDRGITRAGAFTARDYASRMVEILNEFSLVARNWERCDSAFT